MSERKVSLRVSAVGGDKLKAELRSIGKEGQHALQVIEGGGPGASRGLTATGLAAEELMQRLTRLSLQAAQAANSMNGVGTSGTSVLARVNAATGVTGGMARSAEDIAAYGRALDETRAKYNPMFAAIQKYRSDLGDLKQAHAAGAISADEYTAALSRLRRASLQEIGTIKGRVQGYQAMAKQGGMARFQMVQLGYQLNDIGVSLASGQNPFVVMVQQGAQIAQIYGGQGGVRAMFSQIGQLVANLPGPVKAVGIAAGVAALGIAGMTHEINKVSDVTVTFGDTALAVWQVISEGVWEWIKPAADKISGWFWAAWDGVVAGVKWTGNTMINGIKIAVLAIKTAVDTIPDMFVAAWEGAKAAMFDALYKMGAGMESFLGGAAAAINSVFKTNLDENPSFGWVADMDSSRYFAERDRDAASGRSAAAWDAFNQKASDIWNSDPMGGFFDTVAGRAQENARNREAAEADGKGGGGGGKGKSAKEKADEELGFLDKIKKGLADYATAAMDFGQQIGDALVGAFQAAEDALVEFVESGKLDIKSLATSIIADFARIGIRGYIMGPLANALGGLIGGPVGQALTSAFVQHTGGAAGSGPVRAVSAANFVNAPRLHNGMGGIRADEYAAILQRGERVLNRQETRDYESGRFGGAAPIININGVRDVQSFRQSRTQVAADLSRAMGMARRAS